MNATSTAKQRYRAAFLFGSLVLTAVVVACLVVLVQVAFQTNQLAADARDCASPGGDCFARTQEQNEARAQQTRRIVVAVGFCARTEPNPKNIAACVAKQLDPPIAPPGG